MTTGAGQANCVSPPLHQKIFIIAGEHSGDALGAKLISALHRQRPDALQIAGVGGHDMEAEGLTSLFPIDDVAVMGPLNILPALPRIVRRVYQTVDAALSFAPDAVVIIDSPEFTHPIAKRIRKRAPHIAIIDYVSPSVWAWRSGRARKMRAYVDEVLALLPFEPDAHARLGGPHCTYVGHPLIERLPEIAGADADVFGHSVGIAANQPVLMVLPGSRRSEVDRLIDVFGETVALLSDRVSNLAVVIPTVPRLKALIDARTRSWRVRPILIDNGSDKFAAMKRSRAALAASGTVTLELALAGTPMVVAYKVDAMTAAIVRRLVTTDTAVLANLIIGEKAFPEFIQQDCTAAKLSDALIALFAETKERHQQLAALARIPQNLELPFGTPSDAAAAATLIVLDHSAGKSRRG